MYSNNNAQKDPPDDDDDDGINNGDQKKTLPICDGQSDWERLQLRTSYRSLYQRMLHETEELQDATHPNFRDCRISNNVLWDQTRYVREAVCDSQNFQLLAGHAARQIDGHIEVPRYDPLRFCQRLQQKMGKKKRDGNRLLDWRKLGRAVSSCYFQNTLPSHVVFYSGPLQSEFQPKPRSLTKKRRRIDSDVEDGEEDQQPEVMMMKQAPSGSDQKVVLTRVEKNMLQVENLLKENKNKPICAVSFLFNPHSYTQTIENIFHFSFLLKHGTAELYLSEDGIPMIQQISESSSDTTTASTKVPRQAILSLSMSDWRRLKKTFFRSEQEEGIIPDRSINGTNCDYYSKEEEDSKLPAKITVDDTISKHNKPPSDIKKPTEEEIEMKTNEKVLVSPVAAAKLPTENFT